MNSAFEKTFDDFISERMGENIALLKERNKNYCSAVAEYADLMQKANSNEISDYEQAFKTLAQLNEYIRDEESKYLFYAGMATYKRIDGAILSFLLTDHCNE